MKNIIKNGLLIFCFIYCLSIVTAISACNNDSVNCFESYITGDDTSYSFYGSDWGAETFQTCPNCNLVLNSISLKVFKDTGTPGMVTVSIRNVTTDSYGYEHIVGSDISTGTFNGNLVTPSYNGEWINVSLSSVNLKPSQKYAILIRTNTSSQSNSISWRTNLNGDYDGSPGHSVTSGNTWTIPSGNQDYMFALNGIMNSSNTIIVTPYQFKVLPYLTSNVSLDMEGLERTYLFCSWRIDGLGSQGVLMNNTQCPAIQQNFTFSNSENYIVDINYIKIIYNLTINDWQLIENGSAGSLHYKYVLSYPEPSLSWIMTLWNSIWNFLKNIWCVISGNEFCY